MPGSRACVRVLVFPGWVGRAGLVRAFLAGSAGPASGARFGAPHLLLWPVLVRSFFVRPPLGLGCPVCGCFWVFLLFFS